ncbi:MAG: hypothetical protein ACREVP_07775, partial [Burkholderiales bacterium]
MNTEAGEMARWRNLFEFENHVRRSGGLITDGPVAVTFSEGWAKAPFIGRCAHFWRRVGETVNGIW